MGATPSRWRSWIWKAKDRFARTMNAGFMISRWARLRKISGSFRAAQTEACTWHQDQRLSRIACTAHRRVGTEKRAKIQFICSFPTLAGTKSALTVHMGEHYAYAQTLPSRAKPGSIKNERRTSRLCSAKKPDNLKARSHVGGEDGLTLTTQGVPIQLFDAGLALCCQRCGTR